MYSASSIVASPKQVFRLVLLCFVASGALAFPVYWLTKNWEQASMFLMILVTSFISSSSVFKNQLIVLVGTLSLYLAIKRVSKKSVGNQSFVKLLNISAFLFFLSALLVLWTQAFGLSFLGVSHLDWTRRVIDLKLNTSKGKPDIYYIVLDGYGREDILKEYYEYDNSSFVNNLKKRGFIIPLKARSNYPKTALSIPSTLNMDYVVNLLPYLDGVPTSYWWLTEPLIRDSNIQRVLSDEGYHTYSVMTGWGITNNPHVDDYYKPKPIIINDFESYVLNSSPFGIVKPLFSKFSYIPSYEDHRNLILFNFESLSLISKFKGPKFVFAHIIAPHPPFVFDENGNAVTPTYNYSFADATDIKISEDEYRQGYVSQLKFVNKKVEELINNILENSVTEPIIIIQADHGPGMQTDFGSYENTCLKERFSIFAAYFLPKASHQIIPDDITTVNVFRIVLNEYFGMSLPILTNYQYFHQAEINLFQTSDVTSLVDTCFR